jgi:hypothetical protein
MPLFDRKISVDVDEEGENLRLVGVLEDTRGRNPLHGIRVEMVVRAWDGEIVEVTGKMPTRPMEECLEGLGSLDALAGVKIVPGFSDLVKSTVGSNIGCTHLASLVMNMGNVSVLGRYSYMREHVTEESERAAVMLETADSLNLVNSCVCWHEDGPLVQRWRAEHEGRNDAE